MSIIKTAREKMQLSQTELAEKVGCTQTHISSLERGQKSASPKMAKEIAEILSINVIDILYPEQNTND